MNKSEAQNARPMMNPEPNKPAAGNAGFASRLAIGRHWSGVPEPERSAKGGTTHVVVVDTFEIVRPLDMQPSYKHPLTDLDAMMWPIPPRHTHRVIEALRKAGLEFDVTINAPKDDPTWTDSDIFWFRKQDDQQRVQDIVRDVVGGDWT